VPFFAVIPANALRKEGLLPADAQLKICLAPSARRRQARERFHHHSLGIPWNGLVVDG